MLARILNCTAVGQNKSNNTQQEGGNVFRRTPGDKGLSFALDTKDDEKEPTSCRFPHTPRMNKLRRVYKAFKTKLFLRRKRPAMANVPAKESYILKIYKDLLGIDILDMSLVLRDNTLAALYEYAFNLPDSLQKIWINLLDDSFCMWIQFAPDVLQVNEAIGILEGIPQQTVHPPLTSNLGAAYCRRYFLRAQEEDIHQALRLCGNAMGRTSPDHPSRILVLTNHGIMSTAYSLGLHIESKYVIDSAQQAFLQVNKKLLELEDPPGNIYTITNCYRLGLGYCNIFQKSRDQNDVDRAISLLSQALIMAPDDFPLKIFFWYSLAEAYQMRFVLFRHLGDLKDALEIQLKALEGTPDSIPEKPGMLENLTDIYLNRFVLFDDPEDLTKAVSAVTKGLELTPGEKRFQLATLSTKLGVTFRLKYGRYREDQQDLDRALEEYNKALELTPDHIRQPVLWKNVGEILNMKFGLFSRPSDIENAIKAYTKALELAPDGYPAKPMFWNALGTAFLDNFRRFGDLQDLDKAIEAHSKATALGLDTDILKPTFWSCLGDAYEVRFHRFWTSDDIDRALEAYSKAVETLPDDSSVISMITSWMRLGDIFITKFRQFGNIDDLDKGFQAHSKAVAFARDDYPGKGSMLTNLGDTLELRFLRLGEIQDLERALELHNIALALSADDLSLKGHIWAALGTSYSHRFSRLGQISDLEKALEAQQKASDLIPDDSPEKTLFLLKLGDKYTRRFDMVGASRDMAHALSITRRALGVIPEDSPVRYMALLQLGNTLVANYQRMGDMKDLDEAINSFEAARKDIPSDALHMRAECNINYCNVLIARSARLNTREDIYRANHLNSEALKFIKADSLLHIILQCLRVSICLQNFFVSEHVSHLDEAILAGQRALQLMNPNDTTRTRCLTDIGGAYRLRYEHFGDRKDLDEALLHFKEATFLSTSNPLHRLNAALSWAQCTSKINSASSLEGYTYALGLLPMVASLALPLSDRYKTLSPLGDIVRDAAASAIACGEYESAVEWLDHGRSIVWTQLLQLRTPIKNLKKAHPELASRFERVSALLKSTGMELNPPEESTPKGWEQQPSELTKEWEEVVRLVREKPTFEHFLLPKKLSDLKVTVQSGYLVMINVHRLRCDALVLNSQAKVTQISLSAFTLEKAEKLRKMLDEVLSDSCLLDRTERAPRLQAPPKEDPLKNILSILWKDVVKPILNGLNIMTEADISKQPRIWWCATGALAFLPLHAAGIYEDKGASPESGSCISDFVTSSYTPTLSTLLETPKTTPLRPFKLLGVAQSAAEELAVIPQTKNELHTIYKHAARRAGEELSTTFLGLDGASATVERVREEMAKCPWVHMASHGTQNATDPLKSALFLEGERLELLEIIRDPVPNAEFIFLSACQTATGDRTLPEEAVHLASGMLFAGYPSVVGTLWSIKDMDGPAVADVFYGSLFRERRPDPRQTAHALHEAVSKLRKEGAALTSWVPFIHIGL